MTDDKTLQSVIYTPASRGGPALKVLDQLLLPQEKVYIDVPDFQSAWSVIHKMQIRGAPLIAIVACLGLAVDLTQAKSSAELDSIEKMNTVELSGDAVLAYIQGKMHYLSTSRPTAVNLFNALEELKQALVQAKDAKSSSKTPRERMVTAVIEYAEFMFQRDLEGNRKIGALGAEAILKNVADGNMVTVLTICNTGSLATAGYGTALGVVRSVHAAGKLESIVALETRPYNQGSRLTCFECLQDALPGATLICDSMAAAYMHNNRHKKKMACVVGADRIAANGDTANKIGTYALSVAAAAHGVEFYVAASFETLDLQVSSGKEIPIEERPASELILTSKAPENMPVWNPS
jgi:S-methyl-5-thioribose-1-phosphate isomerase